MWGVKHGSACVSERLDTIPHLGLGSGVGNTVHSFGEMQNRMTAKCGDRAAGGVKEIVKVLKCKSFLLNRME